MGQGRDDSPVVPIGEESEVKSVGHSMTLEKDLRDRSDILRYLLQLSQMVGRRARAYKLAGRTVALTIRYSDFTTFTRRETIPGVINSTLEIWKVAGEILSGICIRQPVRLLGISLSNLCPQARQLSIFRWYCCQEKICRVMDQINDRFGDNTITWAELLPIRLHGSRIISPGWRPYGIRRVDVR